MRKAPFYFGTILTFGLLVSLGVYALTPTADEKKFEDKAAIWLTNNQPLITSYFGDAAAEKACGDDEALVCDNETTVYCTDVSTLNKWKVDGKKYSGRKEDPLAGCSYANSPNYENRVVEAPTNNMFIPDKILPRDLRGNLNFCGFAEGTTRIPCKYLRISPGVTSLDQVISRQKDFKKASQNFVSLKGDKGANVEISTTRTHWEQLGMKYRDQNMWPTDYNKNKTARPVPVIPEPPAPPPVTKQEPPPPPPPPIAKIDPCDKWLTATTCLDINEWDTTCREKLASSKLASCRCAFDSCVDGYETVAANFVFGDRRSDRQFMADNRVKERAEATIKSIDNYLNVVTPSTPIYGKDPDHCFFSRAGQLTALKPKLGSTDLFPPNSVCNYNPATDDSHTLGLTKLKSDLKDLENPKAPLTAQRMEEIGVDLQSVKTLAAWMDGRAAASGNKDSQITPIMLQGVISKGDVDTPILNATKILIGHLHALMSSTNAIAFDRILKSPAPKTYPVPADEALAIKDIVVGYQAQAASSNSKSHPECLKPPNATSGTELISFADKFKSDVAVERNLRRIDSLCRPKTGAVCDSKVNTNCYAPSSDGSAN